MPQVLPSDSEAILIEEKSLEAAKCNKCGAKIYPPSLIEAHLMRHESLERWLNTELKKLRRTMRHMREFRVRDAGR